MFALSNFAPKFSICSSLKENSSATGKFGVIGRNLQFLTSPGIFGRRVIVKTIFRIEFRVYSKIFSFVGAIPVQKMTSERQDGFAKKTWSAPIMATQVENFRAKLDRANGPGGPPKAYYGFLTCETPF